jgi:Domian of unknown function (DUF4952)
VHKIFLFLNILAIFGCTWAAVAVDRQPATLTKADLPRAMQPRYIPTTTRSLAPFRLITDRLSMQQVVEVLGVPDRDLGSGLHIYVYTLTDRSRILIGTPDGKQLLYVIHAREHAAQSELFRKGSPSTVALETTTADLDPTACGFLRQWQIQRQKLTLTNCQLSHGQMDTLVATYTVKGSEAHQIERLLQNRFQMGKLRLICCYWDSPEQRGVYRDRDGYQYQIAMNSPETLERDWRKIDRFYVQVTKYLTDP